MTIRSRYSVAKKVASYLSPAQPSSVPAVWLILLRSDTGMAMHSRIKQTDRLGRSKLSRRCMYKVVRRHCSITRNMGRSTSASESALGQSLNL